MTLFWAQSPVSAGDTGATRSGEMVYIYNGPESPLDHRYDYHWQVLREALEKTKPKYGSYRMEAAGYMNEDRQVFELQNRKGKLNVIVRGGVADFQKAFTAVWIPIDKGLLGYRVFLIRKEDQPKFSASMGLDDLKRFTIGQGNGWKDIDILRANGLNVTAGGDYGGLFGMLANGRFDLFSRGVEEVLDEYGQYETRYPNLAIEANLLLLYPMGRHFWFQKSEEGLRLAQRVREGMTRMVEDGTLDRMFATSHKALLERLRLNERKLIILKNPLAATEEPLGDKRLWYNPFSGTRETQAASPQKIASPRNP
jgi:hypothetical protein